jgi:hypothetical protein
MKPALLLLGLLALAAPATAETQNFRSDYSVSLYGVPIARSQFQSWIGEDRFKVEGSLSSAGLAKVFDDTKGTTSASGRFGKDGVRPDAYVVNYTSGKKKKKTAISFAGGDVTATENVPEPKKRSRKWVEVGEDDLKAVADPISATLVRAEGLDDVCNRTLKIYDGQLRADLKLSHVETRPVRTGGYEGDAVTCRARFVPVSGYRKGSDSLEFLAKKSKILIAFAPLGDTGVYAPVKASVGTEIGTIHIEAQRFGSE